MKTETPKKFLAFSKKKAALMFQEKGTPKKFFIFQETELLLAFLKKLVKLSAICDKLLSFTVNHTNI